MDEFADSLETIPLVPVLSKDVTVDLHHSDRTKKFDDCHAVAPTYFRDFAFYDADLKEPHEYQEALMWFLCSHSSLWMSFMQAIYWIYTQTDAVLWCLWMGIKLPLMTAIKLGWDIAIDWTEIEPGEEQPKFKSLGFYPKAWMIFTACIMVTDTVEGPLMTHLGIPNPMLSTLKFRAHNAHLLTLELDDRVYMTPENVCRYHVRLGELWESYRDENLAKYDEWRRDWASTAEPDEPVQRHLRLRKHHQPTNPPKHRLQLRKQPHRTNQPQH